MQKVQKNIFMVFVLFILIIGLWTVDYGLIYAAVPHLINYQGRLTDASGNPLNGSFSITFRIYDAETAGNLLWEETQSSVIVQKGVFSILLGSVTALNLAFDKPYFLEIKVGTEVMTPRQRITSAGYAVRAETAEQAGNAATVNNIGASVTPQANKLLPLDNNAKLPGTAFKVYDSGWFAVSINTTYFKTHNLGTTKVIAIVYLSNTSDGSGYCVDAASTFYPGYVAGTQITSLSTTSISIRTGISCIWYGYPGGSEWVPTSGYCRMILLALE